MESSNLAEILKTLQQEKFQVLAAGTSRGQTNDEVFGALGGYWAGLEQNGRPGCCKEHTCQNIICWFTLF